MSDQILRYACPFIVALLGVAQVVTASEPQVTLTSTTRDEQVSRHHSYVISWSTAGIPAKSALSFQLHWTAADSGVRFGGVPAPAEMRRLITTVFDEEAMKSFLASMHAQPKISFPTIETGKYTWDLDGWCRQNTEDGHSVCMSGVKYRLDIVLRAADDPCGDNEHCSKPRGVYRRFISRGTISFVD